MKINRPASFLGVAASLALVALTLAGSAQAQNVYWSVGLSSPGVQVGLSSAPLVPVQRFYQAVYQPVYQPVQRVYRFEPPVVLVPRPVIYMRPAPALVMPPQLIRTELGYPPRHHGWQRWQQRHEMMEHEGRGRRG